MSSISPTATIEDLKRQLREWTSNDAAGIPVRSNTYSYSSSSASIVDSPLPMSPYVSNAVAQLKPQLSLAPTTRNDGYTDGYSVSSLAFNLSQQMDYNNSLLREMEALEMKLASSDEQVQYLEKEVVQLSGSLRLSNEQTLQLEKQVHATVLQYENVVDENKNLREEAKNSAAEAIRHSAQAEAQRRRSVQVEDGKVHPENTTQPSLYPSYTSLTRPFLYPTYVFLSYPSYIPLQGYTPLVSHLSLPFISNWYPPLVSP